MRLSSFIATIECGRIEWLAVGALDAHELAAEQLAAAGIDGVGRQIELNLDRVAGPQRAAAAAVAACVFDVPCLVGILSRGAGIENTPQRVAEILGGDRRAVRPPCRLAKVERVGQAVVGNLPALGDAGTGFERLRVPADQALEEAVDHIVFGLARDDVGVEALDLRAVAERKIGRRQAARR